MSLAGFYMDLAQNRDLVLLKVKIFCSRKEGDSNTMVLFSSQPFWRLRLFANRTSDDEDMGFGRSREKS